MNNDKIRKLTEVACPIALSIPRVKRHVSLIIRKGGVVSIGTNAMKTHPLAAKIGYRFEEMHSELDSLIRYRGPKDDLTLVNFRFNRFGELRMSRPCSLCMPWCEAVFEKIYYSTRDGFVEHEYSKIDDIPITGIIN
tara:strand:- start:451 stop:861 length:411 start_codon:yes stop_codon:yes gene_type:complete